MLHVNGTANLYGGTVSGGKINIRLNNANAKVTLAGVTVTNAVESATNVRVDVGELIIAEGTTIINTADGATNVATTDSGTSTINMTGGTISGGKNSNVRLLKSDTFTMSGGTITGGSADSGGNVYVVGENASVLATGGTISGGQSTSGANIAIYNASAQVTLRGVTVRNTTAENHSILVYNGELTIEEGTQITNEANKAANVVTGDAADATASISMTGGTISGGSAANGGNINVVGGSDAVATLTISGGTVENGSVTGTNSGHNIRLNNGYSHLIVNNATIPGGIHANAAATVKLIGAPTINKGNNAYNYSIRMGSSAKLIVDGMTGGEVYVHAEPQSGGKVVAENVTTDLSAFFHSDRNGFAVFYENNQLVYKATTE